MKNVFYILTRNLIWVYFLSSSLTSNAQDSLFYKNGTVKAVKVEKITSDLVKFSNPPDSTIHVISTALLEKVFLDINRSYTFFKSAESNPTEYPGYTIIKRNFLYWNFGEFLIFNYLTFGYERFTNNGEVSLYTNQSVGNHPLSLEPVMEDLIYKSNLGFRYYPFGQGSSGTIRFYFGPVIDFWVYRTTPWTALSGISKTFITNYTGIGYNNGLLYQASSKINFAAEIGIGFGKSKHFDWNYQQNAYVPHSIIRIPVSISLNMGYRF